MSYQAKRVLGKEATLNAGGERDEERQNDVR